MGKSDALLFAKEGAKVVIADLQEDKLRGIVREIVESGGEAIALKQQRSFRRRLGSHCRRDSYEVR
ncbi:hypothetical protein ACYCS5_27945 [Paenibacillus sp. SEL3]